MLKLIIAAFVVVVIAHTAVFANVVVAVYFSFVAVNVAVIVRPVELLISNFRLCKF